MMVFKTIRRRGNEEHPEAIGAIHDRAFMSVNIVTQANEAHNN